MPTFQKLDRERGIQRGRTRPTAPGNFLTLQKGGQLYAIVFPPTPETYKYYVLYVAPNSKAFGYVDAPIPPFPLKLIGSALRPESLVPKDLAVLSQAPGEGSPVVLNPAPIVDNSLTENVTAVQTQPFKPGDAFTVLTDTTPKKIVNGPIATKQVFIKSKEGNAADIWIGFRSSVAVNDGWLLAAGSGVVINVDDLGKIYFIGGNATDRLVVMYFV